MFPAVEAGDLLIGFRMEQNFAKNDVVVYEAGGKLMWDVFWDARRT